MKKVFWFINQYASTPETGLGGRNYYIAQELARQGHTVYVIASSFNHLLRQPKDFKENFTFEKIEDNFTFIWVKVPSYSGAHTRQRVLNWFIFSWKLKTLANLNLERPDVIIHSSPSVFGYYGSKWLSRFYQVPYVFEVRDIWPLTLIELGGYSPKHPFIHLMQWVEDRAYKKSDLVFSNLINAVEHMVSRGMDRKKFYWIPNGFSLSEMENKEDLSKEVLALIPKDKFIVGYTGTIGVANAINDLIEAAFILKEKIDEIHFVLVGQGKEKDELMAKCNQLNLNNITFIDAIPKRQVQSIIQKFDCCFIGSQHLPIYRFGVSPNKVPEYLYSGKPIVHAFSGNGCLISQANAGLSIPSGDPKKIAEAISILFDMSRTERENLGENGKKFALENLNYSNIALNLKRIIFESNH